MSKSFRFCPKTIQFPWSDEAACFFSIIGDYERPLFYSVKICLSELTYIAVIKRRVGAISYKDTIRIRVKNLLNVRIVKDYLA